MDLSALPSAPAATTRASTAAGGASDGGFFAQLAMLLGAGEATATATPSPWIQRGVAPAPALTEMPVAGQAPQGPGATAGPQAPATVPEAVITVPLPVPELAAADAPPPPPPEPGWVRIQPTRTPMAARTVPSSAAEGASVSIVTLMREARAALRDAIPDGRPAVTGMAPDVEETLPVLHPLQGAQVANAMPAPSDVQLAAAETVGRHRMSASHTASPAPPPAVPERLSRPMLPEGMPALPGAPAIEAAPVDAGRVETVVTPVPGGPVVAPSAAAPVSDAGITVETAMPSRPALPAADPAAMLAEQVMDMVDHDTWQARLRLDPPSLGEVDVHIAVREGQVSLSLGSQDAQARLLLAQSLPELASQLAARGLQLMGADVGDPSSGRERAPERRLTRRNAEDAMVEHAVAGDQRQQPMGLMDGFA